MKGSHNFVLDAQRRGAGVHLRRAPHRLYLPHPGSAQRPAPQLGHRQRPLLRSGAVAQHELADPAQLTQWSAVRECSGAQVAPLAHLRGLCGLRLDRAAVVAPGVAQQRADRRGARQPRGRPLAAERHEQRAGDGPTGSSPAPTPSSRSGPTSFRAPTPSSTSSRRLPRTTSRNRCARSVPSPSVSARPRVTTSPSAASTTSSAPTHRPSACSS